jgi:hypothetical protein
MPFFIAGLIGALVVIQMARIRAKPSRQSAARFFANLPPPQKRAPILRISHLLLSRAFWLQLAVLLFALLAACTVEVRSPLSDADRIGVWLLVDTSASMSTVQNGETRMAAAQLSALATLQHVSQLQSEQPHCWRMSSFDVELRENVPATTNVELVASALRDLAARPVGTNLNAVRQGVSALAEQQLSCPITHAVVISDQPAPVWVAETKSPVMIWLDIGVPVDNIGFTHITAVRDPLSGLTREVQVEVTAYGRAPADAQLTITAPSGAIETRIAQWQRNLWTETFKPAQPGHYALRVVPGGAYKLDDEASIDIDDVQAIRVDWQHPDKQWLGALTQAGWVETRAQPQLRVLAWPAPLDDVPTLWVGTGYSAQGSRAEIQDFYEPSPLLAELNFDVVESLGLPSVPAPPGFTPVLRGTSGGIWLAQRDQPLAAYVPGLPTNGDDNLGRFSTTVFFNALRWLLQTRAPRAVVQPLADEGNTALTPVSYRSVNDIQPTPAVGAQQPWWPYLLAMLSLVFIGERALMLFGGDRWR